MKSPTRRAKRRSYVAERNSKDKIDLSKPIHKAIKAQLEPRTK